MSARDVIGQALQADPLGPALLHSERIDRILSALAAAGIGTFDTATHAAVPKGAVQFVLDNADLCDEGPYDESWMSDEMIEATDALRGALAAEAEAKEGG